MTPLAYYEQQVSSGLIKKDPEQFEAIQELERIYLALLKQERTAHHLLKNLITLRKKPIKGLYLWGSVGVGKTFLMDAFYHCLPEDKVKKQRMHFHQFMRRIHAELTALQGERNPLQHIAKKLASEARVLCFDEFLVSDIADAMILGELFNALFDQGLCLITSANVPPDHLYREGLQRERFLPAIEHIKSNTVVLHVSSKHDYRVQHTEQADVFYTPLNEHSAKLIEDRFRAFTQGETATSEDLVLFGRNIAVKERTSHVIWFDFNSICQPPRSQKDYLALAEQYEIVLISDVPIFEAHETKAITSFIHLVDVFYDAKTRLILSAEASVQSLYPEGELTFDFARTQSRLIEMQSSDYFKR